MSTLPDTPETSAPTEFDRLIARVLELAEAYARQLAGQWNALGDDPDALSEVELYARLARSERTADCVEFTRPQPDSRLGRLVDTFGLSAVEVAVLQACAAARASASVRRVLASLHEDVAVPQVNESLVAALHDLDGPPLLSSESALLRWRMVRARTHDGPEPWLECDPTIVQWLAGRDELDEKLVGLVAPAPAHEPLGVWPVDEFAETIEQRLQADTTQKLRVWVVGPEGSGRKTFAANVCAKLGLGAMGVTMAQPAPAGFAERVYRQAYWERYAPIWQGRAPDARPLAVAAFPIEFVVTERLCADARRGSELVFEMPALDAATRRALWQRWVPGADQWTDDELDMLASRSSAQLGDVIDVGRTCPDGAAEAARRLSVAQRGRLEPLAQRVECPFEWDDLIVEPKLAERLQTLVFEAMQRDHLLDAPDAARLFASGRGLVALFAGPPGTGKTMAAQVVARRLERDLYRVDLSQLISKYIGETMKQLAQLLERAASLDAILLFDEADALFARRTQVRDSHDRHANTDTNFLLQALEQYRGVALLTSNQRHQLDAAFTRRFRYILDFAPPSATLRTDIWRRLVDALVDVDVDAALEATFPILGEQLELTGAEIKAAVLTALLSARQQARPVRPAHLVAGVQTELEKSGQAMSQRDYEQLVEEVSR